MSHELDYAQFVSFLKVELKSSDNKALNDFETLVEFFQEYPPAGIEDIYSEYATEEIERIVREEIITLIPKLKEKESNWLTIKDGKFELSPSSEEVVHNKGLEESLTGEELKLIKLYYDDLGKNERENILSLYDRKINKLGTIEEKFEILEKLYNSYEYLDEKDSNYIMLLEKISLFSEENKDKGFYKYSYKYYEDAARYYRKRYDHEESANQFKSALVVISELLKNGSKNDDEVLLCSKLKLTRAMRIQYEMAGDELNASKAFIEENKVNRVIQGKSEKSWIHIISDNCQNPVKVALCALGLVIISALIFSLTGITSSAVEQSLFEGKKDWYVVMWDSLYFSMVTFTTLGYGDFSPGGVVSRLVANIVSVFGLLLSSLFLVTLVRKYGR